MLRKVAEYISSLLILTYDRNLPPAARDLVLTLRLHDNGKKMRLHIAIVTPDHVHMIFMLLENEKQETFTFEEIIGSIKGASAHSVNTTGKSRNRLARRIV